MTVELRSEILAGNLIRIYYSPFFGLNHHILPTAVQVAMYNLTLTLRLANPQTEISVLSPPIRCRKTAPARPGTATLNVKESNVALTATSLGIA